MPYLWGGKTFEGTDCSGLVQISLQFCNINFPRNTDQQINFESYQLNQLIKFLEVVYYFGMDMSVFH